MNLVLPLLVTLSSLVIIRGFSNLLKLISNLNWLDRNNSPSPPQDISELPFFIICLPMLREQGVARQTINYFAKLNYPRDKYKIVIVSTEKEELEKQFNAGRIPALASDLHKRVGFCSLKEKYLGLFPERELHSLWQKNAKSPMSYKEIKQLLKKEYAAMPSTNSIVTEIAGNINKKNGQKFIEVLHYDGTSGNMADQVNYAVTHFLGESEYEDAFFALYNADSRPNPSTLTVVAEQININTEAYAIAPRVIQQSSLFTLNYNDLANSPSGYVLKAAAMFQSKWTLVHELTRLRRQSLNVFLKNKNPSFLNLALRTNLAHCVGHGLFVSLSKLEETPFPVDTVNEDLPFGFTQCCLREQIIPISILENSESPITLRSLFNQKKVWFWPYLEYFKCRNTVIARKQYKTLFEVNLLTFEGVFVGIMWLLQSFVFALPLLYLLLFPSPTLIILWITGVLLYWFIPVAVIYSKLPVLESYSGKRVSKTSSVDFVLMSIGGLVIIFTHSIGPILTVKDFLKRALFGYSAVKAKTER